MQCFAKLIVLIWQYFSEINVYVWCTIYETQKKHLLDSFMIFVQTAGFQLR